MLYSDQSLEVHSYNLQNPQSKSPDYIQSDTGYKSYELQL